jgi:hypothetical protein
VPVRLVQQLDHERKTALVRFRGIINPALVDKSDDALFGKIIHHAVQYHGLPPTVLADAFSVSAGTISRWGAGKTAPQPFARPLVIEWIRDWARREAEKI